MTELKTLLRRIGVPEQEEFFTLQHPYFDLETGSHRAAAVPLVPDAADANAATTGRQGVAPTVTPQTTVNRISNVPATDAEIMSIPAVVTVPSVPSSYLNLQESHGYLPKPYDALRLTHVVPSVIVCDRSLANINAIRVVFILETLRLCVWHVWENLVSYMGGVRAHVRTEVLMLANRMLSASTAAESKRL